MQPERIVLGDVVFGRTVGYDIRESLREIEGDGDIEYTVNGRPVYLGSPEFRQYELTVSGDGVRPPAIARLWRGMIIDPVVPAEELVDYVLAGEATVELGFDPWPGTVKCVGAVSGARLPHAVVGRVVTLDAAPEEDVEVRARPSFKMMVKAKTQDGQRGRSTSWSVILTNCPRN